MRSRLRPLAPPWFVVLGAIAYLIAEAFIQWVERRLGVVALDLKVGPGHAVLYAVAAVYGMHRAVTRHPFFDRGHQDWLTRTPWTVEKPLPLGPIQLCGRDLVVLGLLIALHLVSPVRDSMRMLCVFLFIHCALLTYANWWTTNRTYAYLAAFGLALMIRLAPHPRACFATGAAVYLVAHEGVWQALRAFPWEKSLTTQMQPFVALSEQAVRDGKGEPKPCGWPYDELLRDPVAATGSPETGVDALIWCLLLGWWISCLASRFTERFDAVGFTRFCMAGSFAVPLFWRLIVYLNGYRSPLNTLGRIATGRWIIPGHDVVFLAPTLMILTAATAAVGFALWDVPVEIYGPIFSALAAFLALQTPPSLRRWRLTGEHRIVQAPTSSRYLVGVGSSTQSY